jgi:hypothetical protein
MNDELWKSEPDTVEFQHSGYACLLKRSKRLGVWCGYVAVPPGHPMHGQQYDEVAVEVHGGLTYASKCNQSLGICHVPQPGESDDVWWLGFDCGHPGDYVPNPDWGIGGLSMFGGDEAGGRYGIYRDLAFVRAETEKLADQIAAEK